MFDETKAYLKKKGLLTGDPYDLPTSDMRFPDGAHFRIEVPTCNSPVTFSAILRARNVISMIKKKEGNRKK